VGGDRKWPVRSRKGDRIKWSCPPFLSIFYLLTIRRHLQLRQKLGVKLDVVGFDLRHLLDPLLVVHVVGQRVVWVGNAALRVMVIAMPATTSLNGGIPAGGASGVGFRMFSRIHFQRRTGEVRVAYDKPISTLAWVRIPPELRTAHPVNPVESHQPLVQSGAD
jgi:hypothetical protein